MIIGFTGTRSGMSERQKDFLKRLIEQLQPITKVLHGGCIGADMEFHEICKDYTREVYPGHSSSNPLDLSNRGDYKDADVIHSSQTHFKRNRDIVDSSDILIGAPYSDIKTGGTWYTIKYATKLWLAGGSNKIIILDR